MDFENSGGLQMSENKRLGYLSVRAPLALIERLQIESVRTGKTLQTIVTSTLDQALPHARILVETDRRRERKAD
jgi:hypothetical protein